MPTTLSIVLPTASELTSMGSSEMNELLDSMRKIASAFTNLAPVFALHPAHANADADAAATPSSSSAQPTPSPPSPLYSLSTPDLMSLRSLSSDIISTCVQAGIFSEQVCMDRVEVARTARDTASKGARQQTDKVKNASGPVQAIKDEIAKLIKDKDQTEADARAEQVHADDWDRAKRRRLKLNLDAGEMVRVGQSIIDDARDIGRRYPTPDPSGVGGSGGPSGSGSGSGSGA